MPFLSSAARTALVVLNALEERGPTGREGAEGPVPPLDRVRAIRTLLTAPDSDPAVLAGVREALDAGARLAAGRKRSARPSSVPTDLPGHSVAEAARILGITAQGVYLRITRGTLHATTVVLDDGRSYKRVLL
jgi:hypothetical protein